MIRYPISIAAIEAKINERVASWMGRAAARTAHFREVGRYDETFSIWSEIKPVFMEIQSNKCAYCERRLAGSDVAAPENESTTGRIEQDVDHFRPKSAAKSWPDPSHRSYVNLSYPFSTGGDGPGYHLLAYALANYVVACKTCNSELKKTYFPVASKRMGDTGDPELLAKEKPYLIYPLGTTDDDPRALIGFKGVLPIPLGKTQHRRRRGQVTIDFFLLHKRDSLRRERAEIISALCFVLAATQDPAKSQDYRDVARTAIDALTDRSGRHSSCASCFVALWNTNRDEAEQLAMEALAASGIPRQ
jgi:hypothetical protein